MNRDTIYRLTAIFMITLLNLLPGPAAAEAPSGGQGLDTARIERLTGVKGKLDEKEGVFKVSQPRADLRVTAAGVEMTPPLGLTSWAAFMKAGGRTLVMGDMVLLEDQVNPVMSVALDNGLEITALHNHFFWDSPKVMFMHIGGTGDEEKLAAAVGEVFAKVEETRGGRGEVPFAAIDPPKPRSIPRKSRRSSAPKASWPEASSRSPSGEPRPWKVTPSAARWASTPGPRSQAATSKRSSTVTSSCARTNCSRCSKRCAAPASRS